MTFDVAHRHTKADKRTVLCFVIFRGFYILHCTITVNDFQMTRSALANGLRHNMTLRSLWRSSYISYHIISYHITGRTAGSQV